MSSPTITIRVGKNDKELISDYAEAFGKSVSDFVRETVLERIEDELDLKAWDEAMKEYEANPVSFSVEEIEKKYL